jgi:acetate kinase
VATEEVEYWLNKWSGLLGVSGSSQDVRDLLAAEERGDPSAALALDMFCYRVRKYIGAYLAALRGAEAVVFGGGIGENSPSIRERIKAKGHLTLTSPPNPHRKCAWNWPNTSPHRLDIDPW